MPKTGKQTHVVQDSRIPLPADDPIYKGGWTIGVQRLSGSSKNTSEKASPPRNEDPTSSSNPLPPEIEEWASKGIYEAAAHQMSQGSPETPKDQEEDTNPLEK